MAPPPAPPPDGAEPLPRAQVRTACAVVGCLGLVVVVAVSALVYIVLTVLGDLTPQPTGTEKEKPKKASARPDPVGPTALKTDRHTVPLDAPFDAVGRAANGRFLLLRQPAKGELAVFDPVEAKVVRSIPLGEKNALFAGGAGKLYVYRPKAKELDQFDLLTGEKDETAKKPDTFPDGIDYLLVGDGVDAPVLALAAGNTRVDAGVIDPAPAKWAMHRTAAWAALGDAKQVRTSADGRTVGAGSATGGAVLNFGPPDQFATANTSPGRRGHITPSPNGRYLYSILGSQYAFPTAHGDGLFLSVAVGDNGRLEPPLRLHLADTGAVVGAIPAALPTGLNADDAASPAMDQRVHLWPAAGLLAVLPTSNAAVELYKVDVPALLARSKQDYLVFGSEPPTTATRGDFWKYTPTVWSSPAGAVTLELTNVSGGTVKDGQIVWPVEPPKRVTEPFVRVVAKHPGGRTAEQSIRVRILDP